MSIILKGIDIPKTDAQAIQISYWTKDGHYIAESYPISRLVEIPTAHWEKHPEDREWDVCSNCHIGVKRREYGWLKDEQEWVSEYSYQYCPWCGAKMEE